MIGRLSPCLLALILLLSACSSFGPEPVELSPEVQEHFETLRTTDTFAGPAVGITGATPQTVHAFRHFLQDPDGDRAFKALLEEATLTGQLYALAGLRLTNPEYFERTASRYLNDDRGVRTFFGCLMDESPASTIAEDIVEGSLAQWLRGTSEN